MDTTSDPKAKVPAGSAEEAPSTPPAQPEAVPTLPAPPLDADYGWDPARDPMEGLDPATTWWGG